MFRPPTLKQTPFVQFRAGKMKYANGIVSPDLRKGYLSFVKKPSSDMVEVVWTSNDTEEEEVAVWKKDEVDVSFVDKCTTGRVLLFKVTEQSKKKLHFFWLQDQSDAQDAQHLAALKTVFTEKAVEQNRASTVQLDEFKKILASISGTGRGYNVHLADLVSSSFVKDAVKADADFYMDRLKDTLPAELASSGSVLEQIQNPQFTQAAGLLDQGLRDPETCRHICKLYGLPDNVTSFAGFIGAIMESAKESEEQ